MDPDLIVMLDEEPDDLGTPEACTNPWADKLDNPSPSDYCNPWADKLGG